MVLVFKGKIIFSTYFFKHLWFHVPLEDFINENEVVIPLTPDYHDLSSEKGFSPHLPLEQNEIKPLALLVHNSDVNFLVYNKNGKRISTILSIQSNFVHSYTSLKPMLHFKHNLKKYLDENYTIEDVYQELLSIDAHSNKNDFLYILDIKEIKDNFENDLSNFIYPFVLKDSEVVNLKLEDIKTISEM